MAWVGLVIDDFVQLLDDLSQGADRLGHLFNRDSCLLLIAVIMMRLGWLAAVIAIMQVAR